MTPEELRRWSAEKVMGWYLQDSMVKIVTGEGGSGYFDKTGLLYYEEDWIPDNPATGQIWLVVEGIKKLDCRLELWTLGDDRYHAIIWKFKEEPHQAQAKDTNPCLAILRAAYAAIEPIAPNSQ